jgi:hypothetical protein
MKRRLLLGCSLLLTLGCFGNLNSFGQFADRAVIIGVVTDASGAAVPDAKVTITDQGMGVQTVVGTNSAGNYTTPPLILGTYKVTIEKTGFKTFSREGIVLSGGSTFREDAALQLGAVSETVQVTEEVQQINTENPTVSHTLDNNYYKELPAVMGADIRLAESLLQLQPGYVPMQPNGDAIFRGSQFTSRMNGGQTMATENWFDGAAFGYAEGHQQTQESSIPYPSVQEMTVVENTFSSQYGHTSGGFITYATKSGTSKFHGNVYDFYTSDKFDASNYFVGPLLIANGRKNKLPLGQNNWGFALGGPVPKIKKTFWFFNLDGLDYHSTVNTGLVNTLPTALQRTGDFSQFLTTTQLTGTCPKGTLNAGTNYNVTDVLGNPIFQGDLFDPASTTNVIPTATNPCTGVLATTGVMRTKFAGNRTGGASNPLWSSLATAVVPNIPGLDLDRLRVNGFGGNSDDNNKINVRTWLFRFDHTFNDKFSIANSYYENIRPRIAHCGGPGGCTTVNNGETASEKNDTYIGQGFYQRITNHFDHFQMNWIIRPNLFNHTTLAYDRWMMLGHQLSGGVGWNQQLGLGLPNEPIFNNAGFPQLNFNGPVGYTHFGTPWASQGADINNRYQFLDDVTWTAGKHTIKAGMEFRYMTFPQTGWAVNTGGNFNFNSAETAGFDQTGAILGGSTGNEFASFLLGQVDSANFSVPFKYMPKMKYGAAWVNDDFKLTSRLNITLGLRFDFQGGLTEEFGRFSTFDPSAPNPVASGVTVPGATVFHSSKANGQSSTNVGPRLGFAYSLNPKTVIRGGYGMYYAGVQADSWDPYPVDGYQTNPTAPNLTGGKTPAFYFQGTKSCPPTLTKLPNTTISCGWPSGTIVLPSQATLVPSIANGGNPVGVDPKTYTMPRYQNWSVSFQRQLSQNMAIDLAYVGNHGTRLIDGRSSAGVYDNMNPGSVITTYGTAALTEGFNANGTCNNANGANCGGLKAPYAGFVGTVAQSLRMWPQYQQINWRFFPFGNSHYNALQASFERRMAAGFQFKVAYTYSKLMNNGSETGLGSGGPPVQDPSNMRSLNSVSSDDVPNILSLGWIYKLPFGKGKPLLGSASGFLNKIIGDWQISGIQSYSSGRPLSITTDNSALGPILFNYNHFPNKTGSGKSGSFKNVYTDSYLNQGAWSDPGAFSFGNAPREDAAVRGFHYFNEDISLAKDIFITESKYLKFHADAGNAFNRVFFCPVDQFWLPNSGNSDFGKTSSQCNIPRRAQFALELFF